jgi:hypothetical protein
MPRSLPQLVTVLAFYITPFLRFDFSHALLLTLFPTFMMSIAFMVRGLAWRCELMRKPIAAVKWRAAAIRV